MGEEGYRKLIVWQNAYKLRRVIYEITKRFPKTEVRRVSQMRDAARSVKQNIQEGYGRTLPVYINSLQIAKGSVTELQGDVQDCLDDGLIIQEEFSDLDSLIGRTDYLFMRLIQALRRKKTA